MPRDYEVNARLSHLASGTWCGLFAFTSVGLKRKDFYLIDWARGFGIDAAELTRGTLWRCECQLTNNGGQGGRSKARFGQFNDSEGRRISCMTW